MRSKPYSKDYLFRVGHFNASRSDHTVRWFFQYQMIERYQSIRVFSGEAQSTRETKYNGRRFHKN